MKYYYLNHGVEIERTKLTGDLNAWIHLAMWEKIQTVRPTWFTGDDTFLSNDSAMYYFRLPARADPWTAIRVPKERVFSTDVTPEDWAMILKLANKPPREIDQSFLDRIKWRMQEL